MYRVKSDRRKGCRARLHSGLWCAFVAMILGLGAARALAQCTEQQKLTASDAAASDRFGGSVSVSGDTAVVGAFTAACAAGGGCGAAYVYRFNGTSWVEEQRLTASDPAADNLFGESVSLSGETTLMSSRTDDCSAGFNCGAAYVFRFNGTSWVEEQKLTASDAAQADEFGRSVSVSGDTAVVGAYQEDCTADVDSNCGAAYVFRFNGTSWVEEQKLTASDAAVNARFGRSVSVSGDTTVVGAIGASGAAYVFRFNGTSWVEEQKLTASDAAQADGFGLSVSLSGDTAVVGAERADCAAGNRCGAAYFFQFNGTSWVEEQKLTPSDPAAEDRFGYFVSVSGDTGFVGAFLDDCAAGLLCGSVYVFDRDVPCCGDENVDPGEECDDAGESASCDTDCTVAECGDGTLNVTAGEECDDAGESASCDTDCTVAECGDGTLNVTAGEECDDAGAPVVTPIARWPSAVTVRST